MILSVKNELKSLIKGVRFVVSSCLENSTNIAVNKQRISSITISLANTLNRELSFDLAFETKSSLSFSVSSALSSACWMVEKKAAEFVAVVNVLYRRMVGVVKKHLRVPEHHTGKKVLFKRQAILACAGGLRL